MATGGKRRYCVREIVPFGIMVLVECANVGNSTLFKAASDQGMNYIVFVLYSFAFSALALLPLSFIFHRKAPRPPLSFAFVGRICLLAVLGFMAQMLGYKGIQYSSPTLSSAMSNLTPAFTFALANFFRMEKLVLRSVRSQAKILGTIISISGALVVVLYEGPAVVRNYSPPLSLPKPALSSPQSNWAVGGLLLTGDYLLLSIWYIVQAQTVQIHPAEFLIVFLYSLCVTIITAPACLLMEPNLKAWSITTELMILALIYAAIVGSSIGTVIHTWGLKVKGPVYVALFRPLSIAIAAIMGVLFLGDTLYLGSVIGAVFISIGFYVVLWGKAKDEGSGIMELQDPETAPLLQ